MVGQCANPRCRKALHYLREGRVFLFARKNTAPDGSSKRGEPEHFWLCGACAEEWTLALNGNDEVQLRETGSRRIRASYAALTAPGS